MSKGYFDDFKQLRDTEGRVISAPDRVIAAQAAPPFPGFQVGLDIAGVYRLCAALGITFLAARCGYSMTAVMHACGV